VNARGGITAARAAIRRPRLGESGGGDRGRGRREIRKLLKQSPSLGRHVPDLIRDAYPDAAKDAVDKTGLPVENFPHRCPYAPDAVLDENHLPEASF
jgi:Domain of unknown function DUF29